MNAPLKILAAAMCVLLLGLPAAQADEGVTDVFIQLGTARNELTIRPREVTLEVGALYRFVVGNSSQSTHIVAAPELRLKVWTIGMMYWTSTPDDPPLVFPEKITLYPGDMMVWIFMPVVEGTYKFGCDDSVHAAAGMHTTIKVISGEML